MIKLYGTNRILKARTATYHFKLFESDNIKEIIRYVNTHAIIPCAVKGGHRHSKNITEIFDVMRIDVDGEGEAEP